MKRRSFFRMALAAMLAPVAACFGTPAPNGAATLKGAISQGKLRGKWIVTLEAGMYTMDRSFEMHNCEVIRGAGMGKTFIASSVSPG